MNVKRRYLVMGLILLLVTLLAACVPGPNQMTGTVDGRDQVAGFWHGLWQGFVAPFVFVVSLFKKNLNIYEIHNDGAWYNFGFLLGLAFFFGGGGNRTARRPQTSCG